MKRFLLASLFLLAPSAQAETDNFGLGNGTNPFTATSLNQVINSYSGIVTAAGSPISQVTLTSTSGFSGTNVLVMLWNPGGFTPVPAAGTSPPGGFDISSNGTGAWELARGNLSGTTFAFTIPLTSGFSATVTPGVTQIITVPEFTTFTVPTGTSVSAAPWNGSTGGVLAFLANDVVTLTGNLDVTGLGFLGGVHNGAGANPITPGTSCLFTDQNTPGLCGFRGQNICTTSLSSNQGTGFGNEANGAGGGLCENTGGGGGGNGASGGTGESNGAQGLNPGAGGANLLFSMLDHIEFGGGGGAGQVLASPGPTTSDGGAGGGVIWFRGKQLTGAGSVLAKGGDGNNGIIGNAASGGGGAGGSVYIRLTGTIFNCNAISVHGGNGGATGAKHGGGGGGGRVFVQASNNCNNPDTNGGTGPGSALNGGDATQDAQPNGAYCLSNSDCSNPNPICSAGICSPCSSSVQCTAAAAPICNGGSCVACDGNGGSAACQARQATTPFCNAVNHQCQSCSSGPAGLCDSLDTSTPFCSGNGSCQACNAAGSTAGTCSTATSGNRPICTTSGFCQACDGSGSPGGGTPTEACSDVAAVTPFCDTTDGKCKGCTAAPQGFCSAQSASTPFCVTTGGTAGACEACNGGNSTFTCTQLNSKAPFCDSNDGQCKSCASGPATACGSINPKTPFCVNSGGNSGSCEACTGSDPTAQSCAGIDATHPFCVNSGGSSGSCEACNGGLPTAMSCGGLSTNTPFCDVNGQCKSCTAGPATACGSINPKTPFCVNSGGNSGSCEACTGSDPTAQTCLNIDGTKPFCVNSGGNSGSCAGCNAGQPSAMTCSGLSANTPFCDVNGQCKPCTAGSATTCSTLNPKTPFCVNSGGSAGSCEACTGGNPTAQTCTSINATTPFCVNAGGNAGSCEACNGSDPTANTCTTVNAATPICTTSGPSTGACGGCTTNISCFNVNPRTPFCNAGPCRACASDNECFTSYGASTPTCITGGGNSGACGACQSDTQCQSLDSTKPICDVSGCRGCTSFSDCEAAYPNAPVCSGGACNPCTDDSQCTAPGRPACLSNGSCHECKPSNTTQCTVASGKAACNFDTNLCQLCTLANSDMGANSIGCATNANGHACEPSPSPAPAGTSVFCGCTTDADCGSSTSGRICDLFTSLCIDGCSRAAGRNDCPSGDFCSTNDTTGTVNGVCTMTCQFDVDCATNMPTMPFCINVSHDDAGVDAGTMGRCAGCRDDNDCGGTTPVCEPTNKVCVQCTTSRLDACSAAATGAICLTDDTCGCNQDSDCGAADSGRICDLVMTHKCMTGCRVLGCNGCPSGLICDGAGLVPGKCVVAVDMATVIPDANFTEPDLSVPVDMQQTGYKLTGGGIGCSIGSLGGGHESSTLWSLILVALALVALRRRRPVK